MPSIDLRDFVLTRSGRWTEESQIDKSFLPSYLALRAVGDKVTLKGPVYVRITHNVEYPAAPGSTAPSVLPKSSYVVSVPPGQSWSYTFSEDDTAMVSEADKQYVSVSIEPMQQAQATPQYLSMQGGLSSTNQGFVTPGITQGVSSCDVAAPIIWDPYFPPVYPGYGPNVSPCSQPASGLSTNFGKAAQQDNSTLQLLAMRINPASQSIVNNSYVPLYQLGTVSDVPCDFAVSDIQNAGQFFPSSCEQCPPGSTISIPPSQTPGIKVHSADGGCVRPRFYNGQFITKEDLETLLRWNKLKMQLHNRAAGQGVVWGFDVFRDGQYIAVRPGYGVDCCGHDLTINKTYCVDINALMCDPAAAPVLARTGKQCLHLLLEYHECHEQPKPVHGDQCSNDQSLCEMSRTRETVRLRLIPPREYQSVGPIGKFLEELEALKAQPAFRGVFERAERFNAAAMSDLAAADQPPTEIPYTMEIGLKGIFPDVDWEPVPLSTTGEAEISASTYVNPSMLPGEDDIHIRITAKEGQALLSGAMLDPNGNTLAVINGATNQFTGIIRYTQLPILAIDPPMVDHRGGTVQIQELRVGAADGQSAQIVSSPAVNLDGNMVPADIPGAQLRVLSITATVPPVELSVEQPQELPPYFCLFNTCGSGEQPLFPVPPPWIHADPLKSGEAADPKILILAVIHAWLMMEVARNKVGTPDQTNTPQLQAALYIYRILVYLFFGVSDEETTVKIADLMHKLFCLWCKGFLYPGPQCNGEPHGVVIGSVTIEAGNIADVNPWGGRRYVVHYPLLAHWGEQLGIVPLDVMVSRLMSMVCCVAGIPFPDVTKDVPGIGRRPIGVEAVPVGNAVLSVAGSRESYAGKPVVRTEVLSQAEFTTRAARNINAPAAIQPAAGYVRYELSGSPGVALLIPEYTVATAQLQPQAETAVMARSDREKRVLDAAREDVPPLLEEFSEELVVKLLRIAPVPVAEDSPAMEGLRSAGMLSAGSLLSRTPAEIQNKTLKGVDPKVVDEVVKHNDKLAADVTRMTTNVINKFAEEKNLVSFQELNTPENLAEFTKAVSTAIKRRKAIDIPDDMVGITVTNAVKRYAQKNV